ncbi:hypothetical protein [Hyphomonas sp.]|uniref:hypothetical protein n=1 Tax=Hyphomonas sp. TaxID=87 RepID=UPI0032424D1D
MTKQNTPNRRTRNSVSDSRASGSEQADPIDAALLKVMGEGGALNHDRVAEVAGVSRRTVYRRYEDQAALRARIWTLLTSTGVMPDNLDTLLDYGLRDHFRTFDANADATMMTMSSVEGRTMRNERKAERVDAYTDMFSDAVKDLAPADATEAIAIMQLVCSGFAWREMRDQWDLDADRMARAAVWALNAMLADLKARGETPLDQPPE